MTPPEPPTDQLGRPLRTLRLSVTDRCNLRCQYCMPAELFGPEFRFLPKSEILSYEELTVLAAAFLELGVRRIRITGGEPLLRRDLAVLISQLRHLDATIDLALTTNGARLGRMAGELARAGLNRVNVSLDALDPAIAGKMAGRPVCPEDIWQNVLEASAAGLQPKINTVLKRGINENQILPLARRCREAGIPLRFIEYMDVGQSNDWHRDVVVTGREVREILNRQWELKPATNPEASETARRYAYTDGPGEVGFINSISEPFCRGCDRARISARGDLYTCLFASRGVSVKAWLRDEGLMRADLLARLAALWGRRNDRYSEQRAEPASGRESSRAEMWAIGG